MKCALVAVVLLGLFAGTAVADNTSPAQFWAWLTPAGQVAPVVSTNALGLCVGWYNNVSMALSFRCQHNISTSDNVNITASHIHGPNTGNSVSGTAGVLIAADATYGNLGVITLSATATLEQACYLFAGTTYINIHTTSNPNGLLRGQVLNVNDASTPDFFAALDNTQAGYGVDYYTEENTPWAGVGSVSRSGGDLWVDLFHNQVAVNAHIHGASLPGVGSSPQYGLCNMSNILDFSAVCTTENNHLINYWFPETSSLATDLTTGMMYINVHTAEYPSGAIRGQLEAPMSVWGPTADQCSTWIPTGAASTAQVGSFVAILVAAVTALLL